VRLTAAIVDEQRFLARVAGVAAGRRS
jgi:hypothetical protein